MVLVLPADAGPGGASNPKRQNWQPGGGGVERRRHSTCGERTQQPPRSEGTGKFRSTLCLLATKEVEQPRQRIRNPQWEGSPP